MACARRSLTSGFNHLSRRFHPSLSHVISHDRDDRSDPPHPPLTPPSNFRSNPNTNPSVPFSLPFGLQPFLHRSYSSSPSVPSAEGSNDAGYINDVADVLTDPIIDASSTVTAAASAVPAPFPGEVAAAAADSYLPVAALEHVIDAVHSFTGLNWWASIAITTILIRGATLPLLLNQMRATVKLNAMRPEMEELKERMGNSMDPRTMMENQKRMKELFKKHGVTPFTPLKGLFIQGPIFISFFMAISNMVEKVPSFKGGGAFWFTDLTTPDPFYALPILTAVVFLATVELNMQEGMEGNPMADTMKKFSRGLGVLTVPFTASFPKAIFCYWITSNIFSLVYGLVLKRPQVRKFLNLPDMTLPTNSTPQAQPDFFPFSKLISPSSSSPPSLPANQSEPVKSPSDRKGSSSSAVISQRIRNLEKTVKSRNKPKKKRQ